jgi:biopolymer transport protein ExbB
MQRILTILLFLLSAAMSGMACAETPWWQAEWKYRKPVTLDGAAAGLGGDAGRMPVLVRLHHGNFTFDGVAPGGKDLRFVAADGRTILNHQIEQFDSALGMALIWVDAPGVTATGPQTIWMYYGNENAPASGNGQLTFDPDYAAVYHFGEEDGVPRDTTAYGNRARNALGQGMDAVIGRGLALTGEPLVLPASPSLAVAEGGSFTFSAWIEPGPLAPNQVFYARRDGAGALRIGLDNGTPFVEINGARAAAAVTLPMGQPTHVAVSAGGGQVLLYVGGREAARLEAALPALNADTLIGADAPIPEPTPKPEPVKGEAAPQEEAVVMGNPFFGVIDELRLSKTTRSAALIQADALSQGIEARLTAFGADEQAVAASHFAFILKAMPVDAWVVVAVLFCMFLVSWALMIAKSRYFGAVAKANAEFTRQYHESAGQPITRVRELASQGSIHLAALTRSTLWNLYRLALDEVRGRQSHTGGTRLSDAALGAIRASLDAEVIRETERMSARMNWLSTTIEGAPYVGLFGTVIGIMLVFAVAAMAGAVDINSVAPGMAAALLCTAAGLGVAIPALFGYNWLSARAEAIAADMSVFVDEFSARLAEESEDGALAAVAPAGNI